MARTRLRKRRQASLTARVVLLAGWAVVPPAAWAAGNADVPAAGVGLRWIAAGSREHALLRELDRAGDAALTTSGVIPCTAAQAESLAGRWNGDPRADELLAWLRGDGGGDPSDAQALGLRLRPQLELLGFAADPPRQLQPLFLDVRQSDDVDPAWRLRAGVRADATLAPRLIAHAQFDFDSEGTNDPRNRTREFHQLKASNNLEQAYLRYCGGRLAVLLGRANLALGPERLGGLLLSAHAPAPDLLHAELRLGRHRLQAFVAQLSSESWSEQVAVRDSSGATIGTADVPRLLGRHLYGHRLDLQLGDRARVGLTEAIVVSGEGNAVQLKYINPVAFYAQTQVERDGTPSSRVNVFNGIDGDLHWLGVHAYGSLVVDDLQVDAAPRKTWPHQLAWAAGVDVPWSVGFARPALLSYEYRRLGSWTYLHDGPGTDLQHFERPLGAPEGPDVDRHHVRVAAWAHPGWEVWLAGERWRRGANRLATEASRRGHAGEPFPRGRVERRWVGSAAVSRSWAPHVRVALEAAWHRIENVNNTSDDQDVVEVRGTLTLLAPVWSALLTP